MGGYFKMKKYRYEIILLSVLAGISMWIIDAFLDAVFFYKETFIELLITDIPSYELYIRSMIFAGFIVFGLTISRTLSRRFLSERRLKETEDYLQALYDISPDMIFIHGEDGRLIDVNGNVEMTYGYSRDEMLDLMPEDTMGKGYTFEVALKRIHQALREGYIEFEWMARKRSGEEFPVEVRLKRIELTGKDGSPESAVIALVRDISEHMETELNVIKYTRDLEELIKISREISSTTDLRQIYRTVTDSARVLLDLDCSTLMILSDDRKSLAIKETIGFPGTMIDNFVLLEGQGLSTYVIKHKKPGKVIDFRSETRFEVPPVVFEKDITSAVCVPMMMGEEVFGVLIGHTHDKRDFTVEDISLYRSIANNAAVAIKNSMNLNTLSDSESRNRALLEAIPDMMFRLRRDGTYLDFKKARDIETILPPELFLGKNIRGTMPEEIADKAMSNIEKVFKSGNPQQFDYQLETGGEKRSYEARLAMSGEDEVIAIIRDITEQKRSERELEQYRRHLEKLVRERTDELDKRIGEVEMLNRGMINLLEDIQVSYDRARKMSEELAETNAELEAFAYSVSHDLRAPLRAMQGFAGALLEDYAGKLGEKAQNYAKRIVAAAERMDTLIQDLLVYSRIGRSEIQLTPASLKREIDEVLRESGELIKVKGAHIDVGGRMPEVMCHSSTLRRVVSNLISNAVKFVDEGAAPEVHIWAEDKGEMTRLWVADNGIGIEAVHKERIFRVFERLHGIEAYPGTGIGLAIVKKGVERMGGSAGVESEPGKGSRFWIELVKS